MARNRQPTSVQVNGVALLIKDADSNSGLFSSFQRVPGMANMTLPDETGGVNETQLMDGAISAAQIAGVGAITGSIGAITGHATHRFLANKRRNGGNVQVVIIRPATASSTLDGAGSVSAAGRRINVVAGSRDSVKANIREGTLIALADAVTDGYIGYADGAPAATDDHKWRSTLSVAESGEYIELEAAIASAIAANSGEDIVYRRPGILYGGDTGFVCAVNGFGDGDFQAGGAVSANLSLAPSEALPLMQPEWRDLGELRESTGPQYGGTASDVPGPYDGVFAAVPSS